MRLDVHALRALARSCVAGLVAACVAGSLGGCSGATSEVAESEDDIARRSYRFVDANPEVPLSPVARQKIQEALKVLARVAARREAPALSRELARLTVDRIGAGDVLLGSIAGARGIDRWHMCKDYKLPACKGAPPDPADRTWLGDASLGATLEKELAGYQWGNRVYFTIDEELAPGELAATLVHEVNHVANRSECSYYKDIDAHTVDPNRAFVEEFRAFLAECFVAEASPTAARCSESALATTNTYGFRYDLAVISPAEPTALALAKKMTSGAELGHLTPEAGRWPQTFVGCPAR
ncbi:MAG: hypothetical protein IPF92_30890 [Myxococcales bacterium]|nr:hypothetical protein [Myxococcales bacterium]MBL0195617.1 hypothetical protein [Myxococcales bacterium]HQY64998.1 hypothetical protein [Polyangiaceae bacterium]